MQGIRKWLEANKIIFETLAAVLLSVMAIVVSVKANGIASMQAELMRAEQLPIIGFEREHIYDESNTVVDLELAVINYGAPATEFSHQYVSYLTLLYHPQDTKFATVQLPLINYFTLSAISENVTGKLVTFIGNRNVARYVELEHALRDYARNNNAAASLDLVTYVKVEYKDLLQERHIEYYRVDDFRSFKLDESEGSRLFAEHEEAYRNGMEIDFFEATPEILIERWSKLAGAKSTP